MSDRFVGLTYEGGVATLTLDRPPLNVLNIEMMEQMNEAILELRGRTDLKVLVIRGKGKAFSAGVDVADHTRDKVTRMIQVFHRIFESIRLLDVIAVAAVDGMAFGGGFELAIGCNLVVASESARFALPEIKLGVFPPLACVVLPRAAPRRKAMEWILMGDEITVQELSAYGLVNRVVPNDRFEDELRSFVAKITSKSRPVLILAKRAQTESYYAAYEEALYKAENLYLRELMALDDAHEGIKAFMEKRAPTWRDA
ncbi:MAG: enoyl-CoA hydratase-related protein [Gemmatimonadota bacterium]|nr:enoyl-CoA hydratase-related protein [Gemmatimonadota bacterium]MDH3368277.1 enoyl-CoA hydratase-related protein [Gemmatimonadota bacterium]MDH3478057.1 enoyl-CoA hydratase-related protein [Gemmatimonadota bacterium]MDH3570086.1 enoyl-CoA hydratase-related protein [Gemmatimonadota bacterium]MDH5550942.1 enoyl-CoA hydratase-related protein [Gemmatimonadota bacterium]